MQQPLASIPSPSHGAVHLGPLPLRGYALMIILGVIVAVWLGERRWVARGGVSGTVVDVAVWAVPFGLVGGRLYHVITDYQLYFGKTWHPIGAFEVWNGGLGIWGAIAGGALGGYLGCRRRGVSLRAFADAAAPGIALAQAIGRWGNWFNQELYGRPTKLPWAVKIDPLHRPANTPDIATYHPTFLYESLWCVGVAVLVIWAEKRFRLAYGRTFAVYVAAYTVGRAWIEWLRVDTAHHILGLRLNDWTSLVVFLGAVTYLYLHRDRTEIVEGAVGRAVAESETSAEIGTAEEQPAGATADQETREVADETTTTEDSGVDGDAGSEVVVSSGSDAAAAEAGTVSPDVTEAETGPNAGTEAETGAETGAETDAGNETDGDGEVVDAADTPEAERATAESAAEPRADGTRAADGDETDQPGDAGKERATTVIDAGDGT